MAAEAGWKEFAPVLTEALDSEYCGGKTDRMSLLRSLSRIAEPGDQRVAAANRRSLAIASKN